MVLNENKVILGLSGGVDSAVSCIKLKEMDFEVIGYYFNTTGNLIEEEAAKKAARELGIELIIEDVSEEFKSIVINNFVDEYLKSRTPNPCIICNPNIKFKKLIEIADANGAKYIATGHYASKTYFEGKPYLKMAENIKKDQTYMMYRLPSSTIERLILPLEHEKDKDMVRNLALNAKLSNAKKADSQEICFIRDDDNYANYIRMLNPNKISGHFVNNNDKVLGEFDDIIKFTIGQRKGLGIALGEPAYVIDINPSERKVVLGTNDDLFTDVVKSSNNVFTNDNASDYLNKPIFAKVRYAAFPKPCQIIQVGEQIITKFDQKERAVTPGQSIVFYDKDRLIGGGFID